ncbi:MAG: Ig-like domain-containing protein [Acidobacteria bacterium]|nr:Ig-like domain-containing protein [Acidobacteriota bacterium]
MSWAKSARRASVPMAACVCAAMVLTVGSAEAQTGRRAATVRGLDAHPLYFHGESIVLLVDVTSDDFLTWLVDGEVRVLVLDVPPPAPGSVERLEITGTFYDLGRLQDSDPRVRNLPVARIADRLLGKPWPGVGELPVVVATSSRPPREPAATTLRSIVLEPERYTERGVTLTGRFRGRNLYGDMPEAPEESRWDFVLRSADAAVWVVGMEPKGDGFELDLLRRADTGRWLEVTGEVRLEDDMVLVEAGALRLAEPVAEAEPVADARPALPPPVVIFSAPVADDIDVPPDTTVRVQFSRDMDPDSFEGNVRVRYGGPSATDAGPEAPAFEAAYRGRNRVLEIRLDVELERFRSVRVDLLEGITASDGEPLAAWSLAFFTGG